MKSKLVIIGLVLTLLAVLVACAQPAPAPSPTPSPAPSPVPAPAPAPAPAKAKFPTKAIHVVVPYSPGGGFDRVGRVLARYYSQYFKVDAPVDNVPGSGARKGYTQIWTAKPDGYQVGLLNTNVGTFSADLLAPVPYDMTKFSFVGNWSRDYDFMLVGRNSPYKSLKDLQNAKELKASFGGTGEPTWVAGVMLAEAAKINFRYLTGFEGMADMMMAVIRGDANIVSNNPESSKAYIDSGDLVPLFILSAERDPRYPNVPSIAELGYPGLGGSLPSYRTLITAPNTPPEILSILQDAFWAGTQSKEMQDWANTAVVPLSYPLKGPDAAKLVSGVGSEFGKISAVVKKALEASQLK
ncbi:MAG: tripartite tricarboxylate transporter substrate binding protein [Chloroflexota bacterium]|nr:tripartite tricarboxylate transporter substrate binding protein [Chloroflexota bacterium]